jgi:4-amino-4-deoxy-L-arabinose transferase-like glycosyltransferase
VLLLAGCIHAAGARVWRELWTDCRERRSLVFRPWVLAVPGVLLVPFILLALYPPTAFDATLYHLPFARAFTESGGVPFLADLRFPVFPQANEILFAAVMLFGRDVAAHGVQLVATLLTALLLVAWGRGAFPDYRPAGWLAAAVFLGNPIVVHLAATGYIEPGLTLFVTASLVALDRWRNGGGRGWLALAAVLGATAADVKYLGFLFLVIAGLAAVLAGGRSRTPTARLRDGLLFAAVAAAFLAPWYLRIYFHTGNPIFPFLPGVFGGSPWNVSLADERISLLGRLARWVRLPWDLIFEREKYNQQPPFSPVYLAALPLLAFGAAREARVRLPLLVAAAYALACMWLPPDSRYLVPVLPLASLAVAGSVTVAVRRWPGPASRGLVWALCLGCLLPGWLYAGYRIARQGPLPVTPAAREAYLARSLPAHPAIAWLNRTRGSSYTLWALHAENMAYFADGRFLGDWFGPASFGRVLDGLRDPADLHGRLGELGATHLLVTRQKAGLPFAEDAGFQRWFAPVYADSEARLYELRPSPPPSPPVTSRR